MATQWYFQTEGEEAGPVAFSDLVDRVRSGTMTESDLVRSSWNADWQRADTVVGLFHMAKRSSEELAHLDEFSEPEPVTPEPIAEVTAPAVEEEVHRRPGWLQRLWDVGGNRKTNPDGTPLLGPSSANPLAADTAATNASSDATAQTVIPELAGYLSTGSPTDGSAWSSTVDDALASIDARQVSALPVGIRGRALWLCSRLWQKICAASTPSGFFRLAFRLIVAGLCVYFVAVAVDDWLLQEALRFPKRGIPFAQQLAVRRIPFYGVCTAGEYKFFIFDLLFATGAFGYLTARWLDSRAE